MKLAYNVVLIKGVGFPPPKQLLNAFIEPNSKIRKDG